MAAAHDDDDPGFWPGYVAAVSGLVQGLLIMAMALGISIFAMSRLSEMARKAEAAKAAGGLSGAKGGGRDLEAQAISLNPLGQMDLQPSGQMPLMLDTGELDAPGRAAPKLILGQDALRPIRIAFLGDATTTPNSAASMISDAVQIRTAQGAETWRLEAIADLDDPRQRRAAYLRIMGVRAILMELGVAGNAINLQLRNGVAGVGVEGTGGEPQGLVVINPIARRDYMVERSNEAGSTQSADARHMGGTLSGSGAVLSQGARR